MPGGLSAFHSAVVETEPSKRPVTAAFLFLAAANTFSFDFYARQQIGAHLSLFILKSVPFPRASEAELLVHAALRLTCNHPGYEPLWREQLGELWRESRPVFTWPVLESADERWHMRAVIDGFVAQAYGLSRTDYEHVLASFSHRSYPNAPELCLAMFDELEAMGLEAFTRKHDPYWNIPLVTTLPQPVIDLPGTHKAGSKEEGQFVDKSGQIGLLPDHGPLFYSQPAEHLRPARRPVNGPLDPDTLGLIELLIEDKGAIASAEAQDLTGLDAAAVRPYLQHLVETRRARTEGQRRGMRYLRVARA